MREQAEFTTEFLYSMSLPFHSDSLLLLRRYIFNLAIEVSISVATLIFYDLLILPTSRFLVLLDSYLNFYIKCLPLLLPGQSIRWRVLQSYEIQSCFIIAKGKTSKANYSPFGFSLKISGVFKVIALGNRLLNIFKYRNWYINPLVIVFLLLQL